jgi:hypothetical protein
LLTMAAKPPGLTAVVAAFVVGLVVVVINRRRGKRPPSRESFTCSETFFFFVVAVAVPIAGFFVKPLSGAAYGVYVMYGFSAAALLAFSIGILFRWYPFGTLRAASPKDRLAATTSALAIFITLLVLVSAATYKQAAHDYSASSTNPCFAGHGPISRADALYVAVGTLSTAGTGGLQPTSHLCRAIATTQMGFDLVILLLAIPLLVVRVSDWTRDTDPS